jgi:hypothetical protein
MLTAAKTVLTVFILVMGYVYLSGEYTAGAFMKHFWWAYLILIALCLLVAVLEVKQRRK